MLMLGKCPLLDPSKDRDGDVDVDGTSLFRNNRLYERHRRRDCFTGVSRNYVEFMITKKGK
jgi:hypothetical protein